MPDQQRRRIEGAARLFAEALVESYRTAADGTVSAQELNAQLMQQFFNAIVDNLHGQAENMMSVSRDLAEQTQRGQEVAQALMQESVGAYIELSAPCSLWGKRRGTVRVGRNLRNVRQRAKVIDKAFVSDGGYMLPGHPQIWTTINSNSNPGQSIAVKKFRLSHTPRRA